MIVTILFSFSYNSNISILKFIRKDTRITIIADKLGNYMPNTQLEQQISQLLSEKVMLYIFFMKFSS